MIGEAASKIPSEARNQIETVPWRNIIDMRNVLIHNYSSVDPQPIWDVVQNRLSPLKSAIQEVLALLQKQISEKD